MHRLAVDRHARHALRLKRRARLAKTGACKERRLRHHRARGTDSDSEGRDWRRARLAGSRWPRTRSRLPRSSSSTASARTSRCGGRSSIISAARVTPSPSIIPATGQAIRPTARPITTISPPPSSPRWTRSRSSQAHICGLSLGGVVAIAMHHAAPDRCASLIIADSFAAHPDGRGIFNRSVKASRSMTMRELAEDRVEMLLAPNARRCAAR